MKLMQSWDDRKNRNKDCREIFSRIYEKHDWGGKLKYYSGDGSYNRQVTEPYCDMMKKFISDNHIKSVCDLGCGDFHVASQWITDGISYTGLDVVGGMVSSLNRRFGSPGVRFLCRDITRDPLPDAELCVIRQVLQHLSNREIEKILDQVRKYPYVLVTEHVVRKRSAKQYNRDKVHGGQTRVVSGSGVYLDEAPFNLEIKTVLKIPYSGMGRKNEEMITVLLKNE